MNIRVSPGALHGTIQVPPSKSIAHRALICAALAHGTSILSPIDSSKDMEATIQVLRSMGAQIQRDGASVTVTGIQIVPAQADADCMESGSTLRFLLPVAAALGIRATFYGQGRLPERPLSPYLDSFRPKGVFFDAEALPLTLTGKLSPGLFMMPGDVSSQFITGLLFALPLLPGNSVIRLTSPLESAPYIALTLDVLRQFGITVFKDHNGFSIPGGQKYLPQSYLIESDYSNAAFFLTASALDGDVRLNGLSQDSLQGDRAILSILEKFGASFSWTGGQIGSSHGIFQAIHAEVQDVPDLVPILCVAACAVPGITHLKGIRRLKLKESDRAAAMIDGLTALGGHIKESSDALVIEGGFPLHGGIVSSYGDHRIAMSMAIAATFSQSPVIIENAQVVDKSYPGFWHDFRTLGGVADVL